MFYVILGKICYTNFIDKKIHKEKQLNWQMDKSYKFDVGIKEKALFKLKFPYSGHITHEKTVPKCQRKTWRKFKMNNSEAIIIFEKSLFMKKCG